MIDLSAFHLIVLAAIRGFPKQQPTRIIFRSTENDRPAVAGNVTSIVHTARAFDPTAQEAAR